MQTAALTAYPGAALKAIAFGKGPEPSSQNGSGPFLFIWLHFFFYFCLLSIFPHDILIILRSNNNCIYSRLHRNILAVD